MSERLPKHLDDALHAAGLALQFLAGFSPQRYAADVLVQSAVERQVEIVGEACRPALDNTPTLRERLANSPRAIAMRNRIAHGYDTVDHAIDFSTVTECFPVLMVDLQRELGLLRGEN